MTDIVAYYKKANPNEDYRWGLNPSYEDLLQATGLKVLQSETFGAYQGDALAVVEDEAGRVGIAVWGYGSCSGCDTLQAIEPYPNYEAPGTEDWSEVNQEADKMREAVRWVEPNESIKELAARLSENSINDWYIYDESMRGYLKALAANGINN